jgi:2,4-dienoyl-CoA reductase-like NADH-dependent reductase (Old Yellow Enzyme family)/thioredoxin reductase
MLTIYERYFFSGGTAMDTLFSEFPIKALTLPNRIVMPSVASFLIDADGSISTRAVEHYRRRAAGGPAMVIIEACAVSPEGIVSPNQARIHHDCFIAGLAEIASAIRSEGSIPAIQLHHGGRQTPARVIKRKPVAPSPLPCPTIRGDVEPLGIDGIQLLVEKFGEAAERAQQAGFELIEIHGAHGYLINQFLSRFSNIREDEYGGDVTGRSRFAAEIVAAIRARLSDDFPLSFKISAEEFVQGGLTTSETIDILKILVAEGIDVVQVSAGNDATAEWICQPMFMPRACLTPFAGKIKRALGIPVMAVGRINDPHIADRIIASGQADLVCMGRGLLADPEMPKKAREGRFDEIRTCIACNTCMQSIFKRGRVECLVNPSLGREEEMAIIAAEHPKKVVVVGGGPGGLNFSWIAARRGHDVHLFEKRGEFGGQLIPGSRPNHKAELRSLISFLSRQAEIYNVNCHLNRKITAVDIRTFKPDTVVLATGALPVLPPVIGIDLDFVMTYADVLNDGHSLSGLKIVVVGGGPTGLELALHCAEKGCDVTVVEMLPKLGARMEAMTRKLLLKRLKERDTRLLTECRLEKVAPNGVWITDGNARQRMLPAAKVLIAVGARANNRLYQEIRDGGCEVYQIGDCRTPQDAKAAIYESAVLGRKI